VANATSFDPSNERFQAFAPALFVIGAMLALLPFVEVLLGVYPWRVADVMWRFGAVGIMSSGLGSFPVGVLLLLVGAWLTESRAATRTVAVFAIVVCVVLFLLAPLFALDSIQVMGRVKPEGRQRVLVTWLLALLKLLALSVSLGTIGFVGLRASRKPRHGHRPQGRVAAAPHLVSPLAAPRAEPTSTSH